MQKEFSDDIELDMDDANTVVESKLGVKPKNKIKADKNKKPKWKIKIKKTMKL